jgi:amidohydrolase
MTDDKRRICDAVDSRSEELITLSHEIHDNPELSGEEYDAARRQVELLSSFGFETEERYGGLDTSFCARFRGRGPGPVIAFLAEYDALAGIGHACGHNIIAACAAGAGFGISRLMGELDGEIRVIGCPDEERGFGKIRLLKAGAFSEVGYVLEVHPANRNIISRGSVACADVEVEYFGRAAHSSMPSEGINALSALILLFNQVDMLRQTWNTWWVPRANGIITDGGEAANVITPYARGVFILRAQHKKNLLTMIDDLKKVANSSAASVGATVRTKVSEIAAETLPNRAMGRRFAENMRLLGEEMTLPSPDERRGSSDIGNVSLEVPTIHEYIQILCTGEITHTQAFKEAAVSKRADDTVLLAAKGMAMTAYDLLTDPELRESVDLEFRSETAAL